MGIVHDLSVVFRSTTGLRQIGTVDHDIHFKYLVVVVPEARQMREIGTLITNLDTRRIVFKDVDIDFTILSVICESGFITMRNITIINANLDERWSLSGSGGLS